MEAEIRNRYSSRRIFDLPGPNTPQRPNNAVAINVVVISNGTVMLISTTCDVCVILDDENSGPMQAYANRRLNEQKSVMHPVSIIRTKESCGSLCLRVNNFC